MAFLVSPPRRTDIAGVLAVGAMIFLPIATLHLVLHEKLSFDSQGIERVSGLRRQRIEYAEICSLKIRMDASKVGPVPTLLVGTSPGRPPTEIHLRSYLAGDARKMLHILAQHAPQATWSDLASQFLQGH